MDIEYKEVIFCPEDYEYRVHCHICDKICIERFYKNQLKSRAHTNKIRKREQLNKSLQVISQY